jgi:hypothetical protein
MCCVVATLLTLGPRLALLVWWLLNAVRFDRAWSMVKVPEGFLTGLPGWLLPLLACLILPWTSLAYLVVFQGGITGLDWLWLGVGLLLDLGTHGGGAGANRRRQRRRSAED